MPNLNHIGLSEKIKVDTESLETATFEQAQSPIRTIDTGGVPIWQVGEKVLLLWNDKWEKKIDVPLSFKVESGMLAYF